MVTLVEPSRLGVRWGTVTELTRPSTVTFHQPMTLRPKLFGVIDIHAAYSLTPMTGGVRVERVVTVTLPWQVKLVAPLVLARFRRESARTMEALKTQRPLAGHRTAEVTSLWRLSAGSAV